MNRTRHTAHLAVTACALGAVLALAGCGSSSTHASGGTSQGSSSSPTTSSGPSAAGSSSTQSAMITIKDFTFTGPSSVAPGTKVTVKNDDSEAHTVTADQGSAFDVKIDPGKTATFTAPATAGSYKFHCTFHSNMHGTLTVS